MKTVLFVPGFKENRGSRDYDATIQAIEKSGYTVVFIPIQWDRTTLDDWLIELESEYAKYDPNETILAGFSFGAVTAFVAASNRNPYQLWLFSLSPFFNEDIARGNIEASRLRYIGHRRISVFNTYIFQDLAKRVTCKTLVFVGSTERSSVQYRALGAKNSITNNSFISIDTVGHDVSDNRYIEAIRRAIQP